MVENPIIGVIALTYDILSYGMDMLWPVNNPGHLTITLSSSNIIWGGNNALSLDIREAVNFFIEIVGNYTLHSYTIFLG